MAPRPPGKLLLRAGTGNELQPPKPSPSWTRQQRVSGQFSYRRRSLSQDETGKSNKAWGSLTSTSAQTPSSGRASPISSRADSDLDFGLSRPVPSLASRSEGLDKLATQPGSALTPAAVEQCDKAAEEHGVESEQFQSKLASALRFFRFFRDLPPSFFADVMKTATVEEFPVGRVLFKQGDPPGACYLVLSGYVGLYVESNKVGLSDLAAVQPHTRPKRIREHRRRSKSMFSTAPETVAPEEYLEYQQTAEGFGHRAEEMILGRFCDTVAAGKLFGEIGFHGDKERRPLSAKCLEDTVCVVIRKEQYNRARREESKRVEEERLQFLGEHLPGMREALAAGQTEKSSPKGKAASPFAFRQATYSKGHVFLKQGELAEDITYVVVSGHVEFQRHELMAPQQSLVPGLRGSASEAPGPGRHAWVSSEEAEKAGEGRRREITRRVGSLARGGVFGSLASLGTGTEEPFSVVAESATVEVLYINAEAKQRLPRMVVDMLREYVSRSTMFRLGNLRVNRAIDLKRKQTRVAPSFPLLGSLFPTPSKDWSTMSKVSHAPEVEDAPETKQFALARARLLGGSASSPALSKETRQRSKVY
mmetsp:Transcript_51570/g.120269  ORF Transcript_51570/g.120269 Transcript_51570/m.120269 type:complete len:591 (+) Transcript_51570:52-1824(+)